MLRVLNVAYPFVPIGPDAVGGTEQITTAMDRALVAAGHRSIVIGCEGSVVQGELVAVPPSPDRIDPASTQLQHERMRLAITRTMDRVDVIHMHGIDFCEYMPPPGPPLLATYHLPISWYPPHATRIDRPRTWTQCVSASQQRDLWPHPHLLPFIPNGIPLGAFPAPVRRHRYALMLTRICIEKGVHLAIAAADAAGMRLLIAGEISHHPAHQAYFDEQVAPRLGPRARYLGPAGLAQKARLLAGASCLLAPSLAAETSSLVCMEAAASGTPVIAFRSGALPDIVEHGRTGILVDDAAGMAEAMRRVHEIDPRTCRSAARARFSVDRMTALTIDRYAMLAAEG